MAKKEKKAKKAKKGTWSEFKAFITRGNVLDMAVGVVIGGAFGAIVTAVVNILLSVCTWAVPGGLNGLITVLPPLNDMQKGMDPANGLTQVFQKGELQDVATKLAVATYGEAEVAANPMLIESTKSTILGKYTLYGSKYAYNMSATINWGAVINAIISFIIIALVLFIIVKTVAKLQKAREEAKAKALEEHYKKHPEDRPVEVAAAPAAPTEAELLTQIRDLLAEQKSAKK